MIHDCIYTEGREAIDLLTKMLAFDVDKRWETKKLLEHPYFERVRDPESERCVDRAPRFEFEDKKLTQNDLRQLICHEIAYYNPEWRSQHFPDLEFEEDYASAIVDDQKADDPQDNDIDPQQQMSSQASQQPTQSNGSSHEQQQQQSQAPMASASHDPPQ